MAFGQSQNRNWRSCWSLLAKACLVLAFSCVTAVVYLAVRSHDPVYVLRELKNWSDYRKFDTLIVKVARENNLDPRLIKAIVWRESRFQADMIGRNGERGLMQVSEIAAHDWAAAKGVSNFRPEQLLIPEINLEVGTWYLGKAFRRWTGQNNAVPFALAEYNAGRTRADRWYRAAAQRRNGQPVDAETFQQSIEFPSTARYVRAILARYDFYRRRGMLQQE